MKNNKLRPFLRAWGTLPAIFSFADPRCLHLRFRIDFISYFCLILNTQTLKSDSLLLTDTDSLHFLILWHYKCYYNFRFYFARNARKIHRAFLLTELPWLSSPLDCRWRQGKLSTLLISIKYITELSTKNVTEFSITGNWSVFSYFQKLLFFFF